MFGIVLLGLSVPQGGQRGWVPNRLSSFNDFMLVAQASGTQVKSFWLSIDNDGDRVDIRHPAAVGVAFGMADVMTELR